MKIYNAVIVVATLMFGLFGYSQSTIVQHDFNNGDLEPFEECTTKSPNYARVISNRVKTFWAESGYDGGRVSRGAEFCGHELGDWLTYKEGWCGVNVNLGPDYPKNKKAAIVQIMGRNIPASFSTWQSLILIENGDLRINHRAGAGTNNVVEKTVYSNFPYQENVSLIIHFVLSAEQKGELEIWVNGVSSYKASNISFGFGDFENDEQVPGQSRTIFKLGQYNFDSDNYDNNETRTVYYDDVTWYSGSNGYNVVNPADDTATTPTNGSSIVHIRKRNATGFALDGNNGGDNGQNLYLWSQNQNNVNQRWIEIDRGNGYYSYQKQGTNYCIDGNNGGASKQNVYLWTCGANNQNQHWQKVDVGGGAYKLIKRNASGFALDGGSGGANGNNVKLYDSSVTSQNLHWFITSVGTAAKSVADVATVENSAIIYPNPVTTTATIKGAANSIVSVCDITGAILFEKEVVTDEEQIDLSTLATGVYYAQVEGSQSISVLKIVKK